MTRWRVIPAAEVKPGQPRWWLWWPEDDAMGRGPLAHITSLEPLRVAALNRANFSSRWLHPGDNDGTQSYAIVEAPHPTASVAPMIETKRRIEIWRIVREHVIYSLEQEIGNEGMMKEVWEQMDTAAEHAAAEKDLRSLIDVLKRER